jgi:hypothetical protein
MRSFFLFFFSFVTRLYVDLRDLLAKLIQYASRPAITIIGIVDAQVDRLLSIPDKKPCSTTRGMA